MPLGKIMLGRSSSIQGVLPVNSFTRRLSKSGGISRQCDTLQRIFLLSAVMGCLFLGILHSTGRPLTLSANTVAIKLGVTHPQFLEVSNAKHVHHKHVHVVEEKNEEQGKPEHAEAAEKVFVTPPKSIPSLSVRTDKSVPEQENTGDGKENESKNTAAQKQNEGKKAVSEEEREEEEEDSQSEQADDEDTYFDQIRKGGNTTATNENTAVDSFKNDEVGKGEGEEEEEGEEDTNDEDEDDYFDQIRSERPTEGLTPNPQKTEKKTEQVTPDNKSGKPTGPNKVLERGVRKPTPARGLNDTQKEVNATQSETVAPVELPNLESSAFVTLKTGMRVFVHENVCLGSDRTVLLAKKGDDVTVMRQCCLNTTVAASGNAKCPDHLVNQCKLLRGFNRGKPLEVWGPEVARERNVSAGGEGAAYWLTAANQNDPSILRQLLHFFHLYNDKGPQSPKYVISTNMDRPLVEDHVIPSILGKKAMNQSVFADEIKEMSNGLVCAERLVQVDASQSHQLFFTPQHSSTWRTHVHRHILPKDSAEANCPFSNTVILSAKDTIPSELGTDPTLLRALSTHHMPPPTHVHVGPTTDPKHVARVLAGAGLVVTLPSVHSDWVAMATRNTIVLELNDQPPEGGPEQLARGFEGIDVIYRASAGHQIRPDGTISLDEGRLKADLSLAVQRQHMRCGMVWRG